jgi:hypothetical protein
LWNWFHRRQQTAVMKISRSHSRSCKGTSF